VYVYDLQKQKLVTSQLGWYDVPPTALKIQWIWICMKPTTSATSVIWRNSYSYPCLKCDRLWKHVGTLHRHERTCTGSVTSFIDVQDIAWQTPPGS
jgi:hypothetical protein